MSGSSLLFMILIYIFVYFLIYLSILRTSGGIVYKYQVMQKRLFYAIGIGMLIGSLCGACREKEQSDKGGLERVRLVEKKTDLKRSDFLETVDLIHLETRDSSLLGYIPQFLKRPSGFYIWSMGQVLKFDLNGRFLYRIHQKGRGPKEYLNIEAISVDGKDRYLYLHDDQLQKVICYDALTGEYVRNIKLDFRAFTFMVMPDSRHFVFYCGFSPSDALERGNRFPRFIVADSLGKVVKTFVYEHKNVNIPDFYSAKDVFSVLDSTVYCFANYNDTVYSVDRALNIEPAFVLDYGNENQKKNGLLIKKLSHLQKIEGSPEGMGSEEIAVLSRMVRTSKQGLFIGNDGDESTFWLYDWEKKRGVDLGKVTDDLIVPYFFMAADADYFYAPASVPGLKRMVADEPELYDRETVEMVEKLDEDANPVVFKVRVKPM